MTEQDNQTGDVSRVDPATSAGAPPAPPLPPVWANPYASPAHAETGAAADAPPPPPPPPLSPAEIPPLPPALPLPVTSADRGRRSLTWAIVAGVVLALGMCAVVAVLGARVLKVGEQGFTVGQRLIERSRMEYPDTEIVSSSAFTARGVRTSGPETHFRIILRDTRNPEFVFSVLYWAPSSETTNFASYTNSDDFFRIGVLVDQPVASFERMWVRDYPDTQCLYVLELGEPLAETRAYACSYRTTGAKNGKPKEVFFTYVEETDRWTRVTEGEALDAAAGIDPDQTEDAAEESRVSTDAVVAEWLPDFEVWRPYQEPDGPWGVIVRHRARAGLRLAFRPEDLADLESGMIEVVGKDTRKARSFMSWWLAHKPKTVITGVEPDPDMTGAKNVYSVTYSTSMKYPGSFEWMDFIDLKYDPKTGTWKKR